jgi:type IV pilus assembly protein PilX
VALPVVLILLIVIALAGMVAARRSAGVEEITNNTRIGQVAQLSAQSALSFCEGVVIDAVEGGSIHDVATKAKLVTAPELADPNDALARWPTLANWIPGAPALIQVPIQASGASAALSTAAHPYCMAEAMTDNRYLITARGLSTGAEIDAATGRLVGNAGSEVWLQAVISPDVPVLTSTGDGYE